MLICAFRPKEFLDCVAHIRVLSWLLLGSLTHTAIYGTNASTNCIPIPLEASCHVADHVHVIMTGFAEQSNASVLHMSSLFHAFILCQVSHFLIPSNFNRISQLSLTCMLRFGRSIWSKSAQFNSSQETLTHTTFPLRFLQTFGERSHQLYCN